LADGAGLSRPFKAFQFRHAKRSRYFSGRQGPANFLKAIQWLIEEKLLLDPDTLPFLVGSNDFLATSILQDYRLGANRWRPLFGSKAKMLEELLWFYGHGVSAGPEGGTSARLRKALAGAGRPVVCCEVPGCTTEDPSALEVHHIIPQSGNRPHSLQSHDPRNLVALCATHHRLAQRWPVEALDLRDMDGLGRQLCSLLQAGQRPSGHSKNRAL
jgi:hypothetical protein